MIPQDPVPHLTAAWVLFCLIATFLVVAIHDLVVANRKRR